MHIKRLYLKNFRMFRELEISDPGNMVVLVSPNGMGKSTILEAIVGAHELVVPYHQERYQFTEAYGSRGHLKVWPRHMPEPVRTGCAQAEIELEVEANEAEAALLVDNGIGDAVGRAHFTIGDGRFVLNSAADKTAQWLFRYHSPTLGVGFFDHLKASRYHRNSDIGNVESAFTDDATKQLFTGFHREVHDHRKFETFKGFVTGLQLGDFSRHQASGDDHDSLSLLRQVFDDFFAPKCFLGYQLPANGRPIIAVSTAFGEHDIDSLSDGEKEILHILGHLFRFRDLENVVLWDTPELHLNAALESRLNDALHTIAPLNQYWIATHSLEFINRAPVDSLFVIRNRGGEAVLEEARGDERSERIRIYRELGAQVGLQLVSSCVVFCEGKEAQSDKVYLERLTGGRVPGVTFAAGGGCDTLLSAGSKANALLTEATANGDFLAILDRDFRSVDEAVEIENRHNQRVFVWRVHEIENLLIMPTVVYATLDLIGQLRDFTSEDDVRQAIDAAAARIRERTAYQWAAWELYRNQPRLQEVADAGADGEALKRHMAAVRERVLSATHPELVEQTYGLKLTEVDRLIADGRAAEELPGKELLAEFLREHCPMKPSDYMNAAVGVILKSDIAIAEIDRLVRVLEAAVLGPQHAEGPQAEEQEAQGEGQ